MYTIFVKNIDMTSRLVKGSLNVSLKLSKMRSCSATFFSSNDTLDNELIFVDGQDVKVYYNNTLIFGGVISSFSIQAITPIGNNNALIETTIQSEGYHSIANRRTLSAYYATASAYDVVQDVVSVISNDGISAGNIQPGADITNYIVSHKSAKEILDDMASASGYIWYIDNDKKLYFIAEETVFNAPYSIQEQGTFTDYHSLSVSGSVGNYANRVFVVGGIVNGSEISVERSNTSEITNRQAAEGGSGVYGAILKDTNIKTLANAISVGDDFLRKSSITQTSLSFSTYSYGFLPSQKLLVQFPSFFGYESGGLPNHYYLIEEVQIQREDADITKYSISAIRRNNNNFSSKKTEGFREYFETLIKK